MWGSHWISCQHSNTLNQWATSNGTRKRSMPFYELMAIVMAASAFGAQWKGQRVLIQSDCLPVVVALAESRRSSGSRAMMAGIRALLALAARFAFDIRVVHIPGTSNDFSDALSRGRVDAFLALCEQRRVTVDPSPTPLSVESMDLLLQ
jgi:hypothetical protein